MVNQANTSTQLMHPLGVVALIMLVLGMLIVLFPKESLYADPHYTEEPDVISVAYQRVLLAARPDDAGLRIGLVTQLRKLGLNQDAEQALKPLNQSSALASLPQSLQIALQRERLWLQMGRLNDAAAVPDSTLHDLLFETLLIGWPLATIDEVTRPFVSALSLPEQVAFYQARLAKGGYTQDSLALQWELARLARFNSNPELEASVLETIFSLLPENDIRIAEVRERWLTAALESSPELALSAVTKQIETRHKDLLLLDAGVRIALQNGALGRALEWAEQARMLDDRNLERTSELLDLALAQGEQRSAMAYVELVSQLKPTSADFHAKAAQIYSWSHQESKALAHWEVLAYGQKDEQAIAATWQIALNLGRPSEAVEILQFVRSWRKLTVDEWLNLAAAYERLGDEEQAEATLNFGLEDYPDHPTLLNQTLLLASHRKDDARLVTVLASLEQTHGLSDDQVFLFATTYWNQGEPDKAHAVLVRHTLENQSEYWLMRAELASLAGHTQDRDRCLAHLPQSQAFTSGPQQTQRLIGLLLSSGQSQSALGLSEAAYERYRQPAFLMLALESAASAGDLLSVENLLARLDAERIDTSGRADIWAMRARLAQQKGQTDQAATAWAAAVARAPAELDYQIAQVWFWMAAGDRFAETLEGGLRDLSEQASASARVIDVLAYGWLRLGQPEKAVEWFKLGLEPHQQDWRWLKAYSSALRELAQSDQADEIERSAFTLLAADLVEKASAGQDSLPEEEKEKLTQSLVDYLVMYRRQGHADEARQLLIAMRQRASERQGSALSGNPVNASWIQGADEWGGEKLRHRLVVMGMDWALSDQNEADLSLYEQWATAEDVALPAWQQLALSMRQRDGYRIREVVRTFKSELPLADQMLALDQIGERSEALQLARSVEPSLPSQPSPNRDVQVAALLRERNGTAVQGGAFVDSLGQLRQSGVMLEGQTLVGNTPVSAALKGTQLDTLDSSQYALKSDLKSQVALSAVADIDWNERVVSVEGALRSVGGDLLPGGVLSLKLGQGTDFDQSVKAFAGQASVLNSVLSAVGQEHGLTYAAAWQPVDQMQLSGELVWREVDDLDYRSMGQGYSLTAVASRRIQDEGESGLTARIAHQHSRYQAEDDLGRHLGDYFLRLGSDVELFPDRFDRTSLGLRFSDELLHRVMPIWRSSPWHLLADTEVGYSWRASDWDFGLQLGAGYRVTTRDELAFSLGWSESSESGEVHKTALLTYSRSLERF